MSRRLSAAAVEFLRNHIASPLELEALILLESDPSRWWSGEALSAALRQPPTALTRIVDGLAVANLLDVRVGSDVLFRFAPLDDVRPLIREIDAARRTDPSVISRVLEETI